MIGARSAEAHPSVENLGPGAGMDGLPDAEVERHLQTRLVVVVGLRNLDLDCDPLRMRRDLADVGDAVGTPKEADELIGEPCVAEPDLHPSHFLRRGCGRQVQTFRVRPPG